MQIIHGDFAVIVDRATGKFFQKWSSPGCSYYNWVDSVFDAEKYAVDNVKGHDTSWILPPSWKEDFPKTTEFVRVVTKTTRETIREPSKI